MMTRSLPMALCLSILGASVSAADLARWSAGPGDINGIAAIHGSPLLPEQKASTSDQPARIDLSHGASGSLTLAPESTISLREHVEPDGVELLIEVDKGAVQVDLASRGAYRDLEVLSGDLEIRVKGTLFVVERVSKDKSYLAVIHGVVAARTRAAAKAVREWLEVQSRQGLAFGPEGFSGVQDLLQRPQLVQQGNMHVSIQAQALLVTTTSEHVVNTSTPKDSSSTEATWHHDTATTQIVSSLAARDAGSAGIIVADIAKRDATTAGEISALTALTTPSSTPLILATVAASAPDAASSVLELTIKADPGHAGDFLRASIAANPTFAVQFLSNAITAAPKGMATELALAAIAVAPDSTDVIIKTAKATAPNETTNLSDVAVNPNTHIHPASTFIPSVNPKSQSPSLEKFNVPPFSDATPEAIVPPPSKSDSEVTPVLVQESSEIDIVLSTPLLPPQLPIDTAPINHPVSRE